MDNETLTRIAVRIADDEPITPAEAEELEVDPRWPQIKSLVQSQIYPLFKQLRVVSKNEDATALTNIYKEIMKHLAKLAYLMGMTSVKTKMKNLKDRIFD